MRTGVLVAVVIIALVGGACTNDTEGTSTTVETSTTRPASQATVPDLNLENYQVPEETVCFYLTEYVAVPNGPDADNTLTYLDEVPASDVISSTGATDDLPTNSVDIDVLIAQHVRFFYVGPHDPLQVSLFLRDQPEEIHASPIHAIGLSGHINFQPGTDPVKLAVADFALPDTSPSALDPDLVAVVDSGIALPPQTARPDWFYGSNDSRPYVLYEDPIDVEKLGAIPASHGTFVSGLIRQVAPSKQVTFAAARPSNPSKIFPRGESSLPQGLPPTSEIQVAEAIARLILRHSSDGQPTEDVKALNLSLGAYVCDPAKDVDLMTTFAMVGAWLSVFADSETAVMAAGGNETNPSSASVANDLIPFYPAGLTSWNVDGMHGIGAIAIDGAEIVWDVATKDQVDAVPGRTWITETGPGANLVNLSGGGDGETPELVCWSGSSFATAIASARYALGGAASIQTDYSVPGLTFADPDRNALTTVGESGPTTTDARGVCTSSE